MDKYLEKIKELKVEIKNLEEESCYIENEITMNKSRKSELDSAKDNELGKMEDSLTSKKCLEQKNKNLKKLKHKFIINFFFNESSVFTYGISLMGIILSIMFHLPLISSLELSAIFISFSIPGWILSLLISEDNNGYFKTKRNLKNMNMEDIENNIKNQNEKLCNIQYLASIVEKKLEELNLNKETIKREINNKLFEITNIERLREEVIKKYLANNPEANTLFNQEYIKLENAETIKNEKQFVKRKTNNVD